MGQMATPDALAPGREIYSVYCVSCHGSRGRGDGPLAGNLSPPPSNLVDGKALVAYSDSELAALILGGGVSRHRAPMMPAWATILSSEQAAAVVRYLRTLRGN